MVSWLLDTNVLSELVRPSPDVQVLKLVSLYADEIAIAAPVWHEMRYGWLRMPEGQRRDAIGRFLLDVVSPIPVLSYDADAARVHAELRTDMEQLGRTLPFVDGQIAAIAMAHGLMLVTRNLKDFNNIEGLRLASWWA